MARLFFGIWCVLLSCCCCVDATEITIISAKNGSEVRAAFNNLLSYTKPNENKDTIVFFDCDDVLHKNIDASLQKKFISNFLKDLTIKEDVLPQAFKKICQDSPKGIVSHEIPELVQELQHSGVYTFCLTQCTSDEATRQYRIATLQNLGYSFDATLPVAPAASFDVAGLKPRFLQSKVTPPVYDSGVIFAGSASKGDTLEAFLEWLYKLPDAKLVHIKDMTVAFVDDSLTNVNVVADTCRELGVKQFIGIHYNEVEQPESLVPVLPQVSQIQKEMLEVCNVWLPDTDAKYAVLLQKAPQQIPFVFAGTESTLDCSTLSLHQ